MNLTQQLEDKKKMKVLIACEESQAVCKAFRELGHEAYSCDILPCSGGHPEWHIKGDVLRVIKNTNWGYGEKKGNNKAFMFKKGLDDFIQEKDIFQLVSSATHKGR